MIKVISFDMDSTLVDETIDTFIWNVEIPKIYSEQKKVDLETAKKEVFSEYYEAGYIEKTEHWTDIKYWFERLGITNWKELLEDMKKEITVFDDVEETLDYLSKKYKLVLTTLSSKEFVEMKMSASGLGKYFGEKFYSPVITNERTISKTGHDMFSYVLEKLKVNPDEIVHIGDNPGLDYIIPSSLGIKAYIIDRVGEHKGKDIIHSLTELKEIL